MATSKDKYYIEMFKDLTDYNELKNKPLLNAYILEAIHKVTEK